MKKLMFAAAAAAMVIGAEAGGLVDCFGVYDFSATLKTTKGVMANLKAKSNPCIEADATAYVRKQATVKLCGLIWGCDCDFTAEPRPFAGWDIAWDGSAFWNATDKTGYDVFGDDDYNTLKWVVLNRIDTTAKKTEGFWTLNLAAYDEGEVVTEFDLYGAGFGTAAGDLVGACGNSHVYIPSMSGYVVGSRQYSCLSDKKTWAVCKDDPEEETFELLWWSLCDCEVDTSALTIAYGSWSLKFNQSLSNSAANNVKKGKAYYESIRNKVPAYLRDAMDLYPPKESPECIEAKAKVTAAEAAYKAAKTADDAAIVRVDKAVAGVAEVTFEQLSADVEAANQVLTAAKKAQYDSEMYYAAKVTAWQNATNALAIAQASTNQDWTITWLNSSQQKVTSDGKGTDSMIAKFVELKTFTIYEATYGNTIFINDVAKNATATCTALNKAVVTAEGNVRTAQLAMQEAYNALQNANEAVKFAEKAVAEADLRLKNIYALQAQANAELLAAQSEKSQADATLTTASTVLAAAKIAEAEACN